MTRPRKQREDETGDPRIRWDGTSHPGFRQKNIHTPTTSTATVNTEPDPRIAALLEGIIHVEQRPLGEPAWVLCNQRALEDPANAAGDDLECDCGEEVDVTEPHIVLRPTDDQEGYIWRFHRDCRALAEKIAMTSVTSPPPFMWQAIFGNAVREILSGEERNSLVPGVSGNPNEHTLLDPKEWSAYLDPATHRQWKQLQEQNDE